ncbi:MFS general substrate transporter [Thozetella sp. PMI_491]|nr:MFS general substrate transporter [Thozetella sp. PMI_491]
MSQPTHSSVSPKEGWLAWSQVIASFCMSMCSLGLANSFGIFQSYYQEDILSQYSPSEIAWIGTTQGFLLNIVGVISGRAYDLGYVLPFMYGGMALNVAGLMAASFSTTYPTVFLSLGVCVGLGSGGFYVPSLAIVASHFSTRLPLATGISATGSSIGGVLYPVIFRALIDRLGFAWACRVFAILNGSLLAVPCLLIRPPSRQAAGIFDPTALRDVSFLLFSLALFFIWLGIDIPFFYLPAYVQAGELGHSHPQLGDYLLSATNASAILGRVVLGYAAVRIGSALAVWEGTIAASCVLLLGCWAAATRTLENSLPGLIAFSILYGICTGTVTSLISPALLAISPDISVVGTRLGMCILCAGVGFLVGPPIAGVIQNSSAGYFGQGLFAGLTYVAALVALGVMGWGQRRGKSDLSRPEGPSSSMKSSPSDTTVSCDIFENGNAV